MVAAPDVFVPRPDSASFSVRGTRNAAEGQLGSARMQIQTVGAHSAATNLPRAVGIGYLSNREALAGVLAAAGQVPIDDDFELLARLYELFGADALRMAEGHFCAALFDTRQVTLACGKTPGPRLYYRHGRGRRLVFGSELKSFAALDRRLLPFLANREEQLEETPSLTPFEDVYAVIPGECVTFSLDESFVLEHEIYYRPRQRIRYLDPTDDDVYQALRDGLWQAVSGIAGKSAICLVSGGLDSSIVGTLAQRHFQDVRYFSVGTRERNEFASARRFTDSIGATSTDIVFEEGRFLENLTEVVSLLEHPYSRYLEYIVPVHIAHKLIPDDADVILSGYGSDVLFAGFGKPHHGIFDIAQLIRSEYLSTYWANEASQTVGFCHGKFVAYPFFDSGFVDVAMSVSPHLCHLNGVEKYVLRRAFERELAPEVVWRKKFGIHEGTGCEDFFSRYLTRPGEIVNPAVLRVRKDRLSYGILSAVLIDGVPTSDVNFNEIRREIL
ncbi:asparagine synthase-related protein [Nocardia concava]|uniref:asparagine synthase-related protein n=1 Tax=Nocardia concava TaxID=257281 RepID=UPI0012F9BADC|nr:asparagine synthase-related protein [Nocardia concava]